MVTNKALNKIAPYETRVILLLCTGTFNLSHTHTPAAIHSRRSSSPCRTSMPLDLPVGDNQLGEDSTTDRAAGEGKTKHILYKPATKVSVKGSV